jgi:acetyl esterase/lipase
LAEALKKAGVDVIFQRLPGTGHGGPAFYLPAVRDLIIAFFEKYLRQKDVKVEVLPPLAVTVTNLEKLGSA